MDTSLFKKPTSVYLFIFCLPITLLLSQPMAAQVMDRLQQAEFKTGGGSVDRSILETDSTALLYGPHTSRFLYEEDIFENSTSYHLMDTSITNFHRFNVIGRNNFMYQDLGTIGTASQSIFHELPRDIGVSTGFNAFQPYKVNPQRLRYFNTFSPLSDWYYAQGNEGRSWLDITMAQNIKPNWSIAAGYVRTNSRVIVGQRSQGRNTRQAVHHGVTAQTYYHTPDYRYHLTAHFRADVQNNDQETGGIDTDQFVVQDTLTFQDIFELPPAQIGNRLSGVSSTNEDFGFRIYQHYGLIDTVAVQVFHSIDRQSFSYAFSDQAANGQANGPNAAFYRPFAQDSTFLPNQPSYQINFQQLDNKVGLKGTIGPLFYAGFARLRQIRQRDSFEEGQLIPRQIDDQFSVGAQLNYTLPKQLGRLKILAENQPANQDAKLEIMATLPWLQAKLSRYTVRPNQIMQYFGSRLLNWRNENDFVSTTTDRLEVSTTIRPFKNASITPFAEYTRIANFQYFDSLARPAQLSEDINYLRAGLNLDIKIGPIRQLAYAFYTLNDFQSVLRTPELFGNYQIFFEGNLFKKAIYIQLGLDFHYHTAFLMDAYMPITQQFHLQNQQLIGDYLYSDFFLNFNLNRVRMFIKVSNLSEGLMANGFYTAPNYMAPRRELEFGLNWYLFD